MQTTQIIILVCAGLGMFALLGLVTFLSSHYNLDGIKSKTVGDGQYGTARFATDMEIKKTYSHVPYEPKLWRQGKNLPETQGIVVGGKFSHGGVTALIDSGDLHLLMIGAAGVGKTANFLYPCIEYACASGMSFLCTDTKGDLFRNYAGIAEKYYGYKISILDLRNPTRSDGDNILGMVNKYMDLWLENPENLAYKARAEKYAKITAKTIISSGADSSSYGQNAFFYDAAEGLLTSVLLLIAEYCPKEQRHIVSVFKLIQDLLAPSPVKGKNQFQLLMQKQPPDHKAKWFAGAALNTADQAMASVLSTAMSRLNAVAPNSESAEVLSKALGNKTVLSGSISRGKNDPSQGLQMIQRPLMTPDELKSLPKGHFILAKTGCHPMRTELRLFFKWGIEFEEGYVAEQHAARAISYADRLTLEQEILRRRMDDDLEEFEEPPAPSGPPVSGGMGQGQITERTVPLQPHRPAGRPPLRTD